VKDLRAYGHSIPVDNTWSAGQLAEPEVVLDVTRLYDEYADFVWRSLQRLGVGESSLADALQDVFVVVHRRLGTFDSTAKMSTWLFGICLRVAAAHRRRACSRYEQGSLELDEHPDHSGLASPEQSAMRHEAERRLELVLNTMALERRAVFVMFEIEGMPAGAIAEVLGVPTGTVYSRLHKARAEFGNAVARLGFGNESGDHP
jgi:RNA polymerase sigma-70 factor, ECF subfamily